MQRWLLALDEPASNPCGNTITSHKPSGAAIATALAVSGGNQISPDGDGLKLSLRIPNERYACNPDSLYALPRTELHEIEWIEPDSIDAEVSRLVTGSSTTTTTTTRNNPRRCCRTSTSSGYSSHSPPLSAGSCSFYATAGAGQGSFRAAPLTVRDQFGGGLAVIHEGEAIPRPIWPSALPAPREFYHSEENPEYDALYACCGCGCGCTYAYSYCDWDSGQSSTTSARDVLLELSRTLNSVIEGETAMTPEEILHNISHTVAQGIGLKGGIYEYYHNSSLLANRNKSSSVNDKNSSLLGSNKSTPTRINPVNSKLYSNTCHFYVHNPAWYTSRCSCEHTNRFLRSISSFAPKDDELTEATDEPRKKESDCERGTKSGSLLQNSRKTSGSRVCKCLNRSNYQAKRVQSIYANRQIGENAKKTIGMAGGVKQNRNGISSGEPEYTMQLGCSDGGSSSEGVPVSSKKTSWDDHRIRGFGGDFDFTLDVTRTERLGRAIAKAKRKRQWCRALTTLFGLVFFFLSVVVVSLFVTRGRKVFGSM